MALIPLIAVSLFFCYKYNLFSKKFTTSVQVFKKKCKIKTSAACVFLDFSLNTANGVIFIALSEKQALWIWQQRLCFCNSLLSSLPSPHLFLKCSIFSSLWEKIVLYTSFKPWLAQDEKLSYKELLKDSKLSTPGLSELFKDDSSFFFIFFLLLFNLAQRVLFY